MYSEEEKQVISELLRWEGVSQVHLIADTLREFGVGATGFLYDPITVTEGPPTKHEELEAWTSMRDDEYDDEYDDQYDDEYDEDGPGQAMTAISLVPLPDGVGFEMQRSVKRLFLPLESAEALYTRLGELIAALRDLEGGG